MTIEEDIANLAKKIDEILKRLDSIENRIPVIERVKKSTENIVSRKSISDLILGLKNEGFFDQPRYLREIVDGLATRGYHYEQSSLTWTLQNLVRKNLIGRIKKDDKWSYVKR